ncbi:hypothetical protein GMOD_00007799 [Pyrenophora seminiperda CCB06]|uniref:Uncharacterized protein n=1 Tax=Pyrenophora seminiperda CCB06 TaxID=1302712 RepID=A0A3M7ME30_9PLEO|nr:hypothetical protein GMOD_00007799 [Pyrenophora seminiperda CCB06]
MDHANLKLVVQDVDKASSKLEELFSLQNRHDSVEIRHIASGSQLDLTERDNPTISDVYDNILERWIAPLPPQVPVSVRRAKERLARRVAAELVFSCTRVREIGLDDKTTGPEDIPSQESGGILPILPTKEAILYPLSQFFASQPLPTPPPSSLPGSSPPIPSSASLVPSDPLSRLRMHLRCEESSQTPVSIANSISQLCAHWQTGTDPCVYDWVATERNLQPERREEREKRERREKRQQREDKRKQFVAMNQPTTLPRSCPGLMLGGMSSSSQMPTHSQSQTQLSTQSGGFMIPQSQVERGRFGGRPEKKKNKKGRISGF